MLKGDPWLDRWLPLVQEKVGDVAIFELGCGTGRDTATLAKAGHRIIAIDLSSASILAAKGRVPEAQFLYQSILDPFPVSEHGTNVIVASLSLHYFSWDVTISLVERIQRTLRPGGVLLCRFNSTDDHHFGASGHEMIEPNFYLVDSQPKRFFDRRSLVTLFSKGWEMKCIEAMVIDRYAHPKAVWEVVVARS